MSELAYRSCLGTSAWVLCRICGIAADVGQGRLDELIRTRGGTDLCNMCAAGAA